MLPNTGYTWTEGIATHFIFIYDFICIKENHETLAKEDVDFQEMDYSDDGHFENEDKKHIYLLFHEQSWKSRYKSRSISTRNNEQSWKSRYIWIQFHKMLVLASFPMDNIAFFYYF